jgi:uncharacterized protein (TIGR00730 family)
MQNGTAQSRRGTRDLWLIDRIVRQFSTGFETLSGLGPAVSVFGSARLIEGSSLYKLGVALGEALSKAGYAVITGGGPGLMEAANRGVKQAGGKSVGLNIQLPLEQGANPYSDVAIEFEHFFTRKVMFLRYSQAFFVLPGGFGTMDELFEALTLIQTGKVERKPIILIDRSFWGGMLSWLDEAMVKLQTISDRDLKLMHVVDSPQEAITSLRNWNQQLRSPAQSPIF